MAVSALHSGLDLAKAAEEPCPIVEAYLTARKAEQQTSAGGEPDVQARLAWFQKHGAEKYGLSWSISSSGHAALVALLTAERLDNLIANFSVPGAGKRRGPLSFDHEVRREIDEIVEGLLNLFRYLSPAANPSLTPLAKEIGFPDPD
jgi:hypothetical protein